MWPSPYGKWRVTSRDAPFSVSGRRGPMVTEDDVRRLALPETSEKLMYGTPAFYVRDRWFARIKEEGDLLVLPVASQEDKQELIAAQPGTFGSTPHYDGHAIVLVRFGVVDPARWASR